MTTKTTLRSLLLTCLAVTSLAILGARPTMAQTDPCAVPVALPDGSGNFAVNNLGNSDPNNPNINLQAARYGNASFIEFSSDPGFTLVSGPMGMVTAFFPLSGNEGDIIAWTLLPPYEQVKLVYARYVNSCKLLPTPTIIITTSYWPARCNAVITAPTGGFSASVVGGSVVSNSYIEVQFAPGDAAYARASYSKDFSDASTQLYPTEVEGGGSPFSWALPNFGNYMIYVDFLNSCSVNAAPVTPIAVNVSYPNPICSTVINTNGLYITGPGTSNVKVGGPNGTTVTVVPHNTNATWVQLSNSSNFAKATWYELAKNPTIAWVVPAGVGPRTAWSRFANSCKTNLTYGFSNTYTVHY